MGSDFADSEIFEVAATVALMVGAMQSNRVPVTTAFRPASRDSEIAHHYLSECHYVWRHHYGSTYIRFFASDVSNAFFEWMVFGRDTTVGDFFEHTNKVDLLLSKLLPGIRQDNGFRICESACHILATKWQSYSLCDKLGGKWVCNFCQDYMDNASRLTTSSEAEIKPHPDERAKLTKALRFEAL